METRRARKKSEETSSSGGQDTHMNKADKCSICLGVPMFDEASLDACPHKYCYPCITEWIKLRPICPMCKRPVAKVIHRVKKDSDAEITEEVTVGSIQRNAIRERIETDSARPLIRERAELVRRIRHLQRLVRLHDHVFNERQRSGIMEDDSRRHDYVDRINRYQLLLDNWERPRREIISDPAFRILVYELRLQRVPVVNTNNTRMGRNSVSPQYFRDNERNERIRISEFVRRELNAILPNANNLEGVVELVYDLATAHQIMSPQFTSYLREECVALASYVDHFVELLYEFAVSGQDIALFDQNSEYISRIEYRRRLTNMNFVQFGGSINNDDIQVELDNLYPPNRNQAGQNRTESVSPSRLHFVSAYTDALISLRRLLLILETSDGTLSASEDTTLDGTVEAIVQAYVQYRRRVLSRRENSNQLRVQEVSGRNEEIVLTDGDDDDGQGLLNAASRAISRSRRRFERFRRRHRIQRIMNMQLRYGVLRSEYDTFRLGYLNRMLLGADRGSGAVNSSRNEPRVVSASSNGDAVIDLEGPPTLGDDDVMVISEPFEEADSHSRDFNGDIVIDDTEQHNVMFHEGNSRDSVNASIILDDDI